MGRIPNEGLKLYNESGKLALLPRLNGQNPERGIETQDSAGLRGRAQGLNGQNPERGIETANWTTHTFRYFLSEWAESRTRD